MKKGFAPFIYECDLFLEPGIKMSSLLSHT
jgi:hypothetical protein